MHFLDSVWGVYWLWVLQLVEGYCHVYKAGVFAALDVWSVAAAAGVIRLGRTFHLGVDQ